MPAPRRDRRLGAAGRAEGGAGGGGEALRRYRFNTFTAEHFFCGTCGIYTHHRRRSNPNEYGYYVGCLDGIDPYALTVAVPVEDGVHHPSDRR